MVLADCISVEEPFPEGLLDFIDNMANICELRAVAYKDLSSTNRANNLYNFWHLYMNGTED